MTTSWNSSNASDRIDLTAIASEAQVEILAAEAALNGDASPDAAVALTTAELGYYEAELTSLRAAATSLDRAEHGAG